jgi:alpha-1,2-mannosyltransferase
MNPATHARIRLWLALIPALIVAADNWRDLVIRLPVGAHGSANLARDFAGVAYVPGVIAWRGDAAALYDLERLKQTLTQVVPVMPDFLRYLPFYGPQLSVFFSPFARLPYPDALAIWMVLTLATYLACGYAMWRACPRLRGRGAAVVVLLLADATLFYTLSFAQISAIALALVVLAFFALRANRPVLAGVAVGSLVYKPSLGVAAAVVFLAAREWRIVIGAAIGAALQYAAAALYWGPPIFAEYAGALVRYAPYMRDEFYVHHLHSWRSFFELLGMPEGAALTAYAIAAAAGLALTVSCWRSPAPLGVRYAVLLIATVLVNPHIYVYDLVILMPAYLLLWNDCDGGNDESGTWNEERASRRPPFVIPHSQFRISLVALLYACYWTPYLAIVAMKWRIQLSVIALSLLLVFVTFASGALRNGSRAGVDAGMAAR